MKRYVMLEHGNIVDTKDRPLFHIEGNTLWHNSMVQGVIVNQSDNLLDLLEVGDCVEDSDGDILSIDNTYELTNQKIFYSYNVSLINAIWKRNGDTMRRYKL